MQPLPLSFDDIKREKLGEEASLVSALSPRWPRLQVEPASRASSTQLQGSWHNASTGVTWFDRVRHLQERLVPEP